MSTTNGENNGKSKKSAFGTPEKVMSICADMQTAEALRAIDRAKINALANGLPPYSASECKKYNININVNWGELKNVVRDANGQANAALIHTESPYFTCTLEDGPMDKRQEWSMKFTENLNKPMQRGKSGKRHNFLLQTRNASMCLHGIGALLWTKRYSWMPRFVALEDLLIPTDTVIDFSNLRYFGVNLYLTPGEFADLTQSKDTKKGWNKKLCAQILDKTKYRVVPENSMSEFVDRPEHMESVWKQNRGYYYCDAVEKIRLRAFYWQDVEKPQAWHRHIVLRDGLPEIDEVAQKQFIYDGNEEVFAEDIDHILYCLYGDGNLVPPLKYHSVRGLGVDLYAPAETSNRYRCQFMQHCFEQLLMLFRIQDPADRDRLKQVVLSAYGFLPEGLNFVTAQERHQIDPNLAAAAMGQMRQLMQENSSTWKADLNNGQGSDITAREAMIRLNQANKLVGATLKSSYQQESSGYYTELVRRFCEKDSTDPQVKKFREKCIRQGIPESMLNPEKWRISPEKVFGDGDRTQAELQSEWLWQNRTAFDPTAQRKIQRRVTATKLNNPSLATDLVPEVPDNDTEGTRAAEDLFGSLMQGVQCNYRTGIDAQGYVTKLLTMMAMVVKKIQSTDNMGTPNDVIGLMTCAQNVQQYLQVMMGDPEQKQTVKQFADVLAQIINEIKGFSARLMEAQKSQQPDDAEAQAKAQSTVMLAQVKAKINQQNAELKQRQKKMEFELDQQRKNLTTLAEVKRNDLKAHSDLMNQSASNAIDLMHQSRMGALERKQASEEKSSSDS